MATPQIQFARDFALNGGTSPQSFAWEVFDAANRYLTVEVHGRNLGGTITVSYGGTALTLVPGSQVATGSGTSRRSVQVYEMVAPAVGVANITVTHSTNDNGVARVTTWIDVDQTTPLREQSAGVYAQAFTGASQTSSSLSVVSAAGDWVRDAICVSTAATVGSGQSLNGASDSVSRSRSSDKIASGTSTTMEWTFSSGTVAHCAFAVIGATATQPSPADYTGGKGKRSIVSAKNPSGETCGAGATLYLPIAPSCETSNSEVVNRTPWLRSGTFSTPWVKISANAATADTVYTVLQDGAATGVTITVPGGTTGWVSGSGTLSVDGTTSLNVRVVVGAGGSITHDEFQMVFAPTASSAVTLLGAFSSSTMIMASGQVLYIRPHGSRGNDAAEAVSVLYAPMAANWFGLMVRGIANGTSGGAVGRSRVNGANGAQAVSWSSGDQSYKLDTTNVDTLAYGDMICYSVDIAAGTGTLETERWGSFVENSTGWFAMMAAAVPGAGVGLSNGTTYLNVLGELRMATTRETAETRVPFDIAVKGFWLDIGDNTGLGPTVFTVLVDGAAVDMAVIAQSARANVHYVDLWDVVNINAGSVVCVEAANSAANTVVKVRSAGIVAIERVAGVPVDLAGTPTGQSTATGGLDHSVPLAGSAAVQASASAGLSHGVPLAGTAQGQASASGTLAGGAGLAGSAGAQGSASGDLTHGVPLAGNAQGQGSAGGTLDGGASLSGNASGQAGASGALTHGVALSGNAQGQAGASGNLATSGSVGLSGSAQGNASATGGLTVPSSDFPGLTAWPGVRNAPLRSKAEPVPIVAPAAEPISLLEARQHLKIDDTNVADDALIAALIVAARQRAEHETGRRLITQVWDLVLDGFPPASQAIELSSSLIQAQSIVQINYLDAGGVVRAVPLDAFALDAFTLPGYVIPRDGHAWPADAAGTVNSVRVRVACGYGALPNDVPMAIRQWILLQLGAMYEHREAFVTGKSVAELPAGFVDRLLDPYRVWTL